VDKVGPRPNLKNKTYADTHTHEKKKTKKVLSYLIKWGGENYTAGLMIFSKRYLTFEKHDGAHVDEFVKIGLPKCLYFSNFITQCPYF
jgi:hypothetical protein